MYRQISLQFCIYFCIKSDCSHNENNLLVAGTYFLTFTLPDLKVTCLRPSEDLTLHPLVLTSWLWGYIWAWALPYMLCLYTSDSTGCTFLVRPCPSLVHTDLPMIQGYGCPQSLTPSLTLSPCAGAAGLCSCWWELPCCPPHLPAQLPLWGTPSYCSPTNFVELVCSLQSVFTEVKLGNIKPPILSNSHHLYISCVSDSSTNIRFEVKIQPLPSCSWDISLHCWCCTDHFF